MFRVLKEIAEGNEGEGLLKSTRNYRKMKKASK